MKKQFLFIPLIVALAVFGGYRVLKTKPSAHQAEEHEHHEHEHEAGELGHVALTAAARQNANLQIVAAAGATIRTRLPLYGKITSNEEALAHVQPRFPGVAKEVRKRLGDSVAKGELLAVVESNESLRPYEIKSEIAGTVIQKDITLGEFVKNEDTIYSIADLSTVWVDLAVFRQDFGRLETGQAVAIHPGGQAEVLHSTIDYISPFGTEGTQSMLARCIVPNPRGDLRPGLYVTAEVVTGEHDAPLAVLLSAIQKLEEKTVVFVEEGDEFAAREVQLGVRDEKHVAILGGLKPGDRYVANNSFLLKAEIGKEEAEHEH